MMVSDRLLVFLGASLALLVTPGPAVLYIVTRSVDQGTRAGLVSTAGIAVGTLVHIVAATLGLSAVLLASAEVFAAVKYAGAAYLVYLGARRLLGRDGARTSPDRSGGTLWSVFRQGVVVNVLNPKTTVFFLAFLPQFVDPSRGHITLQFALLGAIFLILGVMSDGTYALAAGRAGTWLRRHPVFVTSQRYVAGGVYLGLGGELLIAD